MDPEVARTLDELERKIAEFERALGSVARREQSLTNEAPLTPSTAGPESPQATVKPPHTTGWSRVVDERMGTDAPPVPVAPSRSPRPLAERSPRLPSATPQASPNPPARPPLLRRAPPPPRPEEL